MNSSLFPVTCQTSPFARRVSAANHLREDVYILRKPIVLFKHILAFCNAYKIWGFCASTSFTLFFIAVTCSFVPAPHSLCFSLLLHVLFLFCVSFLHIFVLLWNCYLCCWAKTLINTSWIEFIVIFIIIIVVISVLSLYYLRRDKVKFVACGPC